MTTPDFIRISVKRLSDTNVPMARLDTLVLLEDATGKDRAWLLAHPEFELDGKIATKLHLQIEKRANHTPLAYIRGKSEFYGREFLITPATLQPRAETETMIDKLKGIGLRGEGLVIVDVGTGSGCIAITAKLELPAARVYATEINKDALEIALKNATSLNADIKFLKGHLLEPFFTLTPTPSTQVLLCNLPYVPNDHTINQAAMQEPKVAIFGGHDGLDLYREMFEQIKVSSKKPNYIFTESLPFQHEELANIARQYDYKQVNEEDFIQLFAQITP